MSKERVDLIYSLLQHHLQPTFLQVLDESAEHHGHRGYDQAGSHFAVRIAAPSLQNLSRVAAHQKIYAVLKDLMPDPIHALRIQILVAA